MGIYPISRAYKDLAGLHEHVGATVTPPGSKEQQLSSEPVGYVNPSVTLRRRIRGSGRRGDRVGGRARVGRS